MSSDNQNLYEAMRLAGLIGNVRFPHRTERWVSAAEVWRMAKLGSARAVGQGGELGAIEPGRRGDLVPLRADGAFLRPLSDVLPPEDIIESEE